MLLEQIEHDATSEFVEELKSKICAGYNMESHPGVVELSKIFQDKNLNPLNFPFEYLLNGSLPNVAHLMKKEEPAVVISEVIELKVQPQKNLL